MNSFTRVFHPCCIRFICQLFLIANSIIKCLFWRSVHCKTYSHLWVFKMKYCTTVSFDLSKVAEFSNIEVSQGCPPVVFDGCLPGEKSRRLRIWWAYQQLHQGGLWTVGNWNDLWRSSYRLVDDEKSFSNRPKNDIFWILCFWNTYSHFGSFRSGQQGGFDFCRVIIPNLSSTFDDCMLAGIPNYHWPLDFSLWSMHSTPGTLISTTTMLLPGREVGASGDYHQTSEAGKRRKNWVVGRHSHLWISLLNDGNIKYRRPLCSWKVAFRWQAVDISRCIYWYLFWPWDGNCPDK